MPAPLAHLRVVDLTDILGAFAKRIPGGADVVEVESVRGDPGRRRGRFAGNVEAADRSLGFLHRNGSTRGTVEEGVCR
jgi:hypothetical protein